MKLHATLRRTLAMLLVLIFAMSNMGLAEMVELVADIPAEEPSMEEPVVAEEAPEEEEGDEIAVPEEEPEEPAEPNEAEQPAPEEDEAPAAAQSVTVEVKATDETTLVAYETIEPEGAYDVSYMWERAESADGEWTALDETSDVLASDAADRADYVYRCTVTAGGVSATSEPATYDWGEEPAAEEAQPVVLLDEGFGLAELNALESKPTGDAKIKYDLGDGEDYKEIGEGDSITVTFDGDCSSATDAIHLNFAGLDNAKKYGWVIEDTAGAFKASPSGAFTTPENGTSYPVEESTLQLQWSDSKDNAAVFGPDFKKSVKVKVYAITSGSAEESSGLTEQHYATASVTINLIAKLDAATVKRALELSPANADNNAKVCPGDTIEIGLTDEAAKVYSLTCSTEDDTEGSAKYLTGTDGSYTVTTEPALVDELGSAGKNCTIKATVKQTGNESNTGTASITYKAVEGANKFEIVGAPSSDPTHMNVPLLLGAEHATGSDTATLTLTLGENAPKDAYEAVTWTVTNNQYDASNKYVTFGADDAVLVTGTEVAGSKLNASDKNTITVTAARVTPTSVPVKVTAKGTYYKDGVTVTGEVTWEISVTKPDTTITADDIKIELEPKDGIIGQPAAAAANGEIPAWSKVTVKVSGSKLTGLPVAFAIKDDSGESAKWIKTTGDNNVFAAKTVDGDSAEAAEKEETATIVVKVTTDGTGAGITGGVLSKEVTVKIHPAADTVDFTNSQVTAWKQPNGQPNSKTNPYEIATEDEIDFSAVASSKKASLAAEGGDLLMGKAATVTIAKQPKDTTEGTPTVTEQNVGTKWDKANRATGLYKVNVYATIGTVEKAVKSKDYWFAVKELPDELVITPNKGQKTIYLDTAGSGSAYTLDLTVEPRKGGKAMEDPCLNGLKWILSTVDNADTTLDEQYFVRAEQSGAFDASKISIKKGSAPASGPNLSAQVQVPASLTSAKDNVIGKVVTVSAAIGEHTIACEPVELTIAEKPDVSKFKAALEGAVVFEGATKDNEARKLLTGAAASTQIKANSYWIAQGSTGKVTIDPEKDADGVLTGKKLCYDFTVVGDTDATKKLDWFKIDDQGNIEVPAAVKGKNTLACTSNADDYKEVTLTVYVEGFKGVNEAATFTLEIVSAPASVTYVIDDSTDDRDGKTELPYAMLLDDYVKFKGVLNGPKNSSYEARTTGPVPEFTVVGSVRRNPLKQDTKTESSGEITKLATWTLTSNSTNATIEIDSSNYAKITENATVHFVYQEGIAAANSETCSKNTATQKHRWRIVDAAEDCNKPNAEGHFFTCAHANCDEVSNVKDHGTFEIRTTDDKQKEEDILWKNNPDVSNPAGAVKCAICEWACDHTAEMLTSAKAVEGTIYHEGTCSVCGKTVKEKHVDGTYTQKDNVCDVCGDSAALPTFIDNNNQEIAPGKALVLNVGETYVPNLKIDRAYNWTGTFTVVDSASKDKIEVIDTDTGEIKAKAATDGKTYAKLNAELSIAPSSTTKDEDRITLNMVLDVDVKGIVKNPKISANPTGEYDGGATAYVIQTKKDDEREIVKLTVDLGVQNPNLTGWTWSADDSAKFEYVHKDEETQEWTTTFANVADDPEQSPVTEVWVRAKSYKGGDQITTKTPETLTFSKGGQNSEKVKAQIKIDVLPTLENKTSGNTCEVVDNAIMFDESMGTATDIFQIIQTGSAKVRLGDLSGTKGAFKPFDARYGSVQFDVEPCTDAGSGSEDLSQGDVRNDWLKITSSNGEATVTSLDKKKIEKVMTFLVTATVTLKETETDSKGVTKPRTVVGKRKIKVVQQPTDVALYYWSKEDGGAPTSTALPGNWKEFDSTSKLEVLEGKDVYIMPVVTPMTGTIGASAVKLELPKGVFTYTKDGAQQPLDTDEDLKEWAKEPFPAVGYYTFKIKSKGATSPAVVKASYSGKAVTPDMSITIKRVMQSIALTLDKEGMGVNELVDIGGGKKSPATVTVTASPEPETNDDEIVWSAKWVDSGVEQADALPTGIQGAIDDANKNKALSVELPSSASVSVSYTTIRVFATSKANNDTIAQKDFTLYPAPTIGSNLQLAVEKKTIGSSPLRLILTEGEQTLITEHGYDATHGASTGKTIRPTIEAEKDAAGADAKDQIAQIVDGANDTFYVKGLKSGGTAELQVESYNGIKKTISIEVKDPVSSVKLDKTKITGLTEPVELVVGDKAHPFKVPEGVASAYWDIDGMSVKADDAGFTLEAENASLVDIKWDKENKDWEVTGASTGITNLVLRVGNKTSAEKIEVHVLNSAESIAFERDGKMLTSSQIEIPEGSTEEITIKAKVQPEGAYGTAVFSVPNVTTGFKVEPSTDRTSITVTPEANASTPLKVSASVKNPKYDASAGTGDYNPEEIFGHVEFVIVKEGGDEPGPEEPPIEIPEDVKIIDKREIGPGETTELAVVGVKAGSDVHWQPAAGSVGVVSIQPSEDKMSAVVTGGATAGTVTVQATMNGGIIGSQVLTVLNKISKLNTTSITLSKNEKREAFCPDFEGYDLNGVLGSDLKNIFHYDYGTATTKNYLTIINNEDGYTCQIIGKKVGKNCSISVYDYANNLVGTIPVTMTTSNTGFTLGGIENTTQYMKSTDKLLVPVTFKPSKAKIDLEGYVVDDEGTTVEDGSISFDPATLSVVTDGAVGGPYTVVISAPGYEDRMPLHFDVEIVGDAATAENLSVSVDKVGIDDAFEGVDISTGVTVVVGEKLQAKLVDEDGDVVSGATWAKGDTKKYITVSQTGLITAKKVGTTSIKATVAGGQSVSYTIKVVNAPSKSVMQLVPNKTTRKVAYTEDFQLDLMLKKGSYGGQGKYVYVEWTNGMWPEPVKDKAGWYSFSEDTRYFEEDSEDVVATLKTTWGYSSKPVKIHAQGDYAEAIQLPDDIQLPVSGTVTIQPVNAKENEYADLAWTVGTKALTEGKSVKIQSGVTAKLVDGMTLQLTTKKAKVGTTVAISVVANADAENKDDTTATIAATGTLPADAVIAMDKNVIGVGEKITLSMEYPSDDEPVGAVTYKATSAGGKATVKGNVLTGSKPGLVTVSAQLGGASVTKDVYVVAKPVYSYSQKPSKMAVGETISIGVNIDGYDKGAVLPEGFEATTEGLLTEANVTIKDPTMIYVESIDEIKDDDENTPHRYAVKLKADMAKTNSKGAFTSTTVTIAPQGGKKLTAKITVVNDDDLNTIIQNGETPKVRYPEDVYIGVGETITMPGAMIDGTDVPANIDWRFDEPAKAAAAGLSMTTSGQIKADKKTATAGAAIAMSGAVEIDNYYDEENGTTTIELETTLHIGAKVTNKSQFELVMPKTTMGLNEKVQARVNFLSPAVSSGKVTYKSTKTSYATIDKNTGVITGKKVSADKTSIRATVNGKYNQQALTITADPTGVQFAKSVKNVTLDGGTANDLWNDVSLVGGSSKVAEKYKEYETAFRFAIDETKQDNEILADVDAVTGALTFLPNVTSGTAEVTVTTYNGKTDTVMVVLGNGASQGPDEPGPDVPTKDTVPASIELWVNGQEKTASNRTLMLKEETSVKVKVAVKNKAGQDITDDVSWTWSEDEDKHIEIRNDEIFGVATTFNTTKNAYDVVEATVTVTGTDLKATLSVQVAPTLSGEHLGLFETVSSKLVAFPGTLIEGDEITTSPNQYYVQFDTVGGKITDYANSTAYGKLMGMDITSSDESVLKVTKGSYGNNMLEVTSIKAIAAGTSTLTMTAKYEKTVDGKKVEKNLENTLEVKVAAKPTSDQIEITSDLFDENGVLVLAQGEPGSMNISLPKDIYGEASGWYKEITIQTFEEQEKDREDGNKDQDLVKDPKDETKAPAAGATSAKASVDTSKTTTEGMYDVVVTAYGKNSKTFKMKIVEGLKNNSDAWTYETTPKSQNSGGTETIYAGIGETVELSIAKKATETKEWKHGFGWILVDGTPNIPGLSLTNVTEDGTTVQLTSTKAGKVKVHAILKGFDMTTKATSASYGTYATDGLIDNAEYEIQFCKLPTDANLASNSKIQVDYAETKQNATTTHKVKAGDDDGPYTIGVGETITATVSFTTPATCYTNNISWETTGATNGDDISWTTEGNTITIKGVKKTAPSYIELKAYTMTDGKKVDLKQSVKVIVKDAPSTLMLTTQPNSTDAKDDFEFALSYQKAASGKETTKVYLKLSADESATCSLESNDTDVLSVTENNHNKWTLTVKKWNTAETKPVTLTLRSGNKIVRYTVNVTMT